jgi:hypothetical protein
MSISPHFINTFFGMKVKSAAFFVLYTFLAQENWQKKLGGYSQNFLSQILKI